MKKLKDVYPKIISKENLYQAAYMAARGRRYRDTTADFSFNLEDEIQRLQKELAMKTYRHGTYRVFTIYDPKERRIAAAPFRDRVVHHAAHDVIEPIIDRTFIYDSYACREGKGTHKAVDRAQSFLRANRFCFHGDIKKYFPSIDHSILKDILKKRIEDRELLWLLDEIIDSTQKIVYSDEWRVASERRKTDGEGEELQRSFDMAERDTTGEACLQSNGEFSSEGDVRFGKSDAQSISFDSLKYSRGSGKEAHEGIHSISSSSSRFFSRTRDTNDSSKRTQLSQREQGNNRSHRGDTKDDLWLGKSSGEPRVTSGEKTFFTRHSPLTTSHLTGLPIGNITSQFFANLYLNELDYFIKFDLKQRYYLRYMDDFLVCGNDKAELLTVREKIGDFLKNRLDLNLHEGKSQVYKAKHGIKFLGFRLFKDYRRFTSDNVRRFRKRLKRFSGEWKVASGEKTSHSSLATRHCASVRCWVAHSKYANTAKLRLRIWRDLKEADDCFAEMIRDVINVGANPYGKIPNSKHQIPNNVRMTG